MLVAVQFPLADIRGFLTEETRRISSPDWKNPLVQNFVRSFGGLRPRLKGGLTEWPNEEMFCAANGAPKFVPPLYSRFSQSAGFTRGRCAFRRLFSNGRGLTRVEIGFSIDHAFDRVPEMAVLKAVDDVLSLDVRIPSEDGNFRDCKLSESASSLAKHYLRASTRTKPADQFKPKPSWVTAGEPLAFVELTGVPIDPVGRDLRPVPLPSTDSKLYYTPTLHRGQRIGVWVLSSAARPASGTDDMPRQVRLHLLRLHAERQSLKLVFNYIDNKVIPVQARQTEGDALQDFLNAATGLLLKKEVYGVPMTPLLNTIQAFDNLVTPGQRTTLLAQLNEIRGNVLKKVQACMQPPPTQGGGNVYVYGSSLQLVQIQKGGQLMSQFVDAKGAIIHGDMVVADHINNSFNRVKDSNINADLKTALEGLNNAVRTMAQGIPEEDARGAAKALDTITKEATADEPDKDYFSTGAKKLLDIAQKVGEVAKPVISIVATVAKLLGFPALGGL